MGLARLQLQFKRGTGVPIRELVLAISALPEGTLLADSMEVKTLDSYFDEITLLVENEVFNSRGSIVVDFKREATVVDGKLKVFNSFAGLNLKKALNTEFPTKE